MEDKLEQLEKRVKAIEEKFKEQKTGVVEPECPYKEGELIFVRDGIDWLILPSTGRFYEGRVQTYFYQDYSKDKSTVTWQFHASTNGLKLPE